MIRAILKGSFPGGLFPGGVPLLGSGRGVKSLTYDL